MIVKLTYRYPDEPAGKKANEHIGEASADKTGMGIWIHCPRKERKLIMREWILRCVETRGKGKPHGLERVLDGLPTDEQEDARMLEEAEY